MNITDFREYIASLCSDIQFDYNGKTCGVDPINHQHFEMWCGKNYAEAKNIDEVFSLPIFDGKSLTDVFDKVENIDR